MLSGSPATPPCGRSLAVTGSIVQPPRAARWGGSRPSGWRPTPTSGRSRICPAPGSTGCIHESRPTASFSTWTAPRARPMASKGSRCHARLVRRDPPPDRPAQAKTAAAPGMSIIESKEQRQREGRGACLIDRGPLEGDPNAWRKPATAVLRNLGAHYVPWSLAVRAGTAHASG
jgi:hypothetical protein